MKLHLHADLCRIVIDVSHQTGFDRLLTRAGNLWLGEGVEVVLKSSCLGHTSRCGEAF